MNTDWKHYLQALKKTGADVETATNLDDIKAADDDTIICDLSQFDTVIVAGEDAAKFMQGQFTNDVNDVDDNHSQLSAVCNNKGRMIANFRLFRYQQNYFLSLKSDLTEKTIQHLQNYLLRAQVAIQDVSDQLIHIGVSGPAAAEMLSPFFDHLNQEFDSVSSNEDYIAIRIADEKPRYEVFCSLDKAISLWEKISEHCRIVSPAIWDYLNIQAGLPLIDASTSEEFVPQMVNMDLINGVSFTKGCFTGQEIIARTHYLGKQKRRTYRISIDSDIEPINGSQLATDTSTENQYIGTVVTNHKTDDGSYEALAVIQIAASDGQLKLKQGDSKISLLNLPYTIEENK